MNYNLEEFEDKICSIVEEIYEITLILEDIYDVYKDIYQFEILLRYTLL